MNIVLVDNYDSFTYNLKALLEVASDNKYNIEVLRSRRSLKEVEQLHPDAIVISPGPGRPQKSSLSYQVIDRYRQSLPILGVCLGMQYLNEYFGGFTQHAPLPVHGKTSFIQHDQSGLFLGVEQNLSVARYHSLCIDPCREFKVTSWADQIPMSIEHTQWPLFGVQFHPESFLSDRGLSLVKNFYKTLLNKERRRLDASI